MNVVYSTTCGMYQVVEKDGLLYPQERCVYAIGYGRLSSQQEVDDIRNQGRLTVQEGPFEGWFLGKTYRGVSKGYKNYKTLNSAIMFVNGCSEQLKERRG